MIMKVGVIDLVRDSAPAGRSELPYAYLFLRQNVSVMPQCVATWCRGLGHEVSYASYFGQLAPEKLLPNDLDIVFLCCTTQASGMAYALAKLFRSNGTRTVLGGPHARSFPYDALRFFDIVVGHCDQGVIKDILNGHVGPGATISAALAPREFPGVRERIQDIATATFYGGRPTPLSTVPLVASQGCPYACDFCIDARSTYVAREPEALTDDLRYLGENYPQVLVAYTDPNFAVRFDETLNAIEAARCKSPIRYVMEASLSILRENRLERLRNSGCIYVAPGVESWFDYRQKTGLGGQQGPDKLDEVVERFAELEKRIGGVQANFILGTDGDRGTDPFDLTRDFILRRPDTFPTISIPTPYGGTPLHDQLLDERRILRQLPFAFYGIPFLSMRLRHYETMNYYDLLIRVKRAVVAAPHKRRVAPRGVRFIHGLRRLGIRQELKQLISFRDALADSRALRDFHDGFSEQLPSYYQRAFERKLGRYASLVEPKDRIPEWESESVVQPKTRPLASVLVA
jgi:radical SAM superfamily enzyme YgiQ (UPF0313 family)